jgi:hypothetical protein
MLDTRQQSSLLGHCIDYAHHVQAFMADTTGFIVGGGELQARSEVGCGIVVARAQARDRAVGGGLRWGSDWRAVYRAR